MEKITIGFFALLILVQSCSGQERKTPIKKLETPSKNKAMDKFDTERFKENQREGEWKFKNNRGEAVRQYKIDDGFQEETTLPDGYFILSKSYYENGNLAEMGQRFHGNGFLKGIWTTYDKNGKIESETDYDRPFKFGWEDVLVSLKKNKIDPLDNFTMITRRNDVVGPVWYISWDTKELTPDGKKVLKNVSINGLTGKASKIETFHYDY